MKELVKVTDEYSEELKALDEAGWTICSHFTCVDCPIELNCPFDELLGDESAHKKLDENGFTVLYGPGGMWGVFKRDTVGTVSKLRMVPEEDWVNLL